MGVAGKCKRVVTYTFLLREGALSRNLVSDFRSVYLDSNYTKLQVRKKSKNMTRHVFKSNSMETRF